jgi:multisubunit Na+/H+ antiporter MnhE subunit
MINFAAFFAVLLGLWLMAHAQSVGDVVAGASAAAAAVFIGWRFGGSIADAVQGARGVWAWPRRAGARALGAWRVIRAALRADVTLQPALVRVRALPAESGAAAVIGDTPGVVIVAEDTHGLLAHVIDEKQSEADDLVKRRPAR